MSRSEELDLKLEPNDSSIGDSSAGKDGGSNDGNCGNSVGDAEKELAHCGKDKPIIGREIDCGSDIEADGDVAAQDYENLYGTTPPRQIRRMKCKFPKTPKKEPKSHGYHQPCASREKHKAFGSHKRDYIRKISQDGHQEEVYEDKQRYQRRVPSISVNSLDRYRSITSVPALLDKHNHLSSSHDSCGSFAKSRSFENAAENQNCPSNRIHFMKTFQLLVKLGDKGRRDSRRAVSAHGDMGNQPENWQIRFDQVLWLELQAWRYGRKIEEQDMYLLEERKNVDNTLNEVIQFYFPSQLEQFESLNSFQITPNENLESTDSQEASGSDNLANHLPFAPHDVDNYCSTIDDHFTGPIQLKAMHIIIMILKRIEGTAALYPTIKALAQSHPLYLDEKFVRNYETLNVWLNICKELYHKLHVVATLVNVDAEDNKTWEDWFDHGLGIHLISLLFLYL